MDRLKAIVVITDNLVRELKEAHFDFAGYIYNPLEYAYENYLRYLEISLGDSQKVLFMGMNPGPFGMVQTGVPFGEIKSVKSYLGINSPVRKPVVECPMRPITGMETKRSEVSGARFWQMAEKIGARDEFFKYATVVNYCPLAFISEKGTNITPVELSKNDRAIINRICDENLKKTLDFYCIENHIAIGKYAEEKLSEFGDVIVFPHPSPRNPKSRLFWPDLAYEETRRLIYG